METETGTSESLARKLEAIEHVQADLENHRNNFESVGF